MKRVDQCINGAQAVFFGKIGEMSIPGGGHGAGMTKNCLDMAKA